MLTESQKIIRQEIHSLTVQFLSQKKDWASSWEVARHVNEILNKKYWDFKNLDADTASRRMQELVKQGIVEKKTGKGKKYGASEIGICTLWRLID